MADPKAYLPPSIPSSAIHSLLTSLSLPIPESLVLISTPAAYHKIYRLTWPANTLSPFLPTPPLPHISPDSLILRISGLHVPSLKTRNECAMLKWLASHTSIPLPHVIHYDATTANILGYEYMLMSAVQGESFDSVAARLSPTAYEEHLQSLIPQVVDIISQLSAHTWSHIGGLQIVPGPSSDPPSSQSGVGKEEEGGGRRGEEQGSHLQPTTIVPGPVLDETMWQLPELPLFWSTTPRETLQTLNIAGPYRTYVDLSTAQAERCIHAITVHPLLAPLRIHIPMIRSFLSALHQHSLELNDTRLVLAHRDLHFGNLMWDEEAKRVTAVLDWEFACVVPVQRWDPQRAFMWCGVGGGDVGGEEKRRLREIVEEQCEEKGVGFFEEVGFRGKRQEDMQKAVNYLRAIVEIVPRGEKLVEAWKEAMLLHMEAVCAD